MVYYLAVELLQLLVALKLFRELLRHQLGILAYPKRGVGYIYVYQGIGSRVKIGRATDVLSRLRSHQTATPGGLYIVAVMRVIDDVYAEKYIHRLFKAERISPRQEWFTYSLRLRLFIWLVRDDDLTEQLQTRMG